MVVVRGSAAAIAAQSGRVGTERMISIVRCMTLSQVPPTYPDVAPITEPIVSERNTPTSPTVRDT